MSKNNSDNSLRLWYHMLQSYRHVQRDLREALRVRFGISLPQFQVMAQLANHPDGQTMSEISKALLLSNGNVTGIVERMDQAGWIERRAVEGDRRAVHVVLSKNGKSEFENMMAEYQTWVDEHFAALSDEERANMIAGFRRIRGKS